MLSYALIKTLHEDRLRSLRETRHDINVPRERRVRIRVRMPKALAAKR